MDAPSAPRSKAIESVLVRLEKVHSNGRGWVALCPGHADTERSLSIHQGQDGRALLRCFAGCTVEQIVAALGLTLRDLFEHADGWRPGRESSSSPSPLPPVKRETPKPAAQKLRRVDQGVSGFTLADLAAAKKFDVPFLRDLGLSDDPQRRRVRIPYRNRDGEEVAVRFRAALEGPGRFSWRSGDKPILYGLDRLQEIREAGWVLLVEGESDSWTAWAHGLPALGIPGKTVWRQSWAPYLKGLEIFLWQEPEAEDLVERIAHDLPGLRVIVALEGTKDLSEAHVRGEDVAALVARMRTEAASASDLLAGTPLGDAAEITMRARPVLEAEDPLELVRGAIRRLGYGGDITPAMVLYLSFTSRILAIRPGQMPVHALLLSGASAGKSYTVSVVRRLMPASAWHEIDAGSPRVLIYDRADLRHRVVIFSESDSLPAGEDNPAASAVRSLLQEGVLRYATTVRDPETGRFEAFQIEKPGPTVLVTTSVRSLGEQLSSRMFTLEVRDDQKQIRDALAVQAALELAGGAAPPDEALVAYQELIQSRAPWDVVVPFAKPLAEALGRNPVHSRIMRDFQRLLSLVKTVAVLRHTQRSEERGRLVADRDDYAVVYEMVADTYAASASGASKKIREVVEAVARLKSNREQDPVRLADVVAELDIPKGSASRRVRSAIEGGWLVNREQRRGYPLDLALGDPLPEGSGLPKPADLRGFTVSPLTDGGDEGDQATAPASANVHMIAGTLAARGMSPNQIARALDAQARRPDGRPWTEADVRRLALEDRWRSLWVTAGWPPAGIGEDDLALIAAGLVGDGEEAA